MILSVSAHGRLPRIDIPGHPRCCTQTVQIIDFVINSFRAMIASHRCRVSVIERLLLQPSLLLFQLLLLPPSLPSLLLPGSCETKSKLLPPSLHSLCCSQGLPRRNRSSRCCLLVLLLLLLLILPTHCLTARHGLRKWLEPKFLEPTRATDPGLPFNRTVRLMEAILHQPWGRVVRNTPNCLRDLQRGGCAVGNPAVQ